MTVSRSSLLFTMGLTLAACASNTGVVPMGSGGYMVSGLKHGVWSGGEVKADLLREAAAYCAKQNKQLVHVTSKSEDAVIYQRAASAEVQFRCE